MLLRLVMMLAHRVTIFFWGRLASSLSDLGIVGCKSTAAVYFSNDLCLWPLNNVRKQLLKV